MIFYVLIDYSKGCLN